MGSGIQAVVNQRYDPEVQSPGGCLGSNVMFRCSVPSFVKDYVSVTSWLQLPAFNIYPSTISDGKYHMLPTGELILTNISRVDAQRKYRCRTHHRLTQEAAVSRNEGKIQLSDMKSSVPPIFNKKALSVTAKAGTTVVVPCIAYANPRPRYDLPYNDLLRNSFTLRNITICSCPITSYLGQRDHNEFTSWKRGKSPQGMFCQLKKDETLLKQKGAARDEGRKGWDERPVTGHIWKSFEPVDKARSYILLAIAVILRFIGKYDRKIRDLKGDVGKPDILRKTIHLVTSEEFPSPFFSCRWFYKRNHQDVVVSNDEKFIVQDGILVISNVKQSNGGHYICRAKNSEGSETLEVHLLVTSPLSAHIHPPIQSVHLGKTADLQCSHQGFPITSIQWLKDGQSLRFGPRIRQVTNTQIQIFSVSKEDRGMYQCVVKNDIEMCQGSAELRLGEVYPQFLYKFIEQTMQPGPSVSLKCSASGNPTPQISWLLDGFPLQHSDRLIIGQYVTVFGDVVSHVNVSSVKAEDGGEYECVAENKAGKSSHSAWLNVYGLPYVRPMPPISAVAGKTLVIKCPVAGYPIEGVTWEKDGVRLPTSVRQRVSNNTLSIENVQKDTDQGSYTCFARNRQGHSSHKGVQVKVIVPPKITPFTFAQDLKLGDRISVQCVVVSGDLPLSFTWEKDGEPPPESDSFIVRRYDPFTSALIISAIASNHSGNYTCLVSNQAGTVSHTAPLSVNEQGQPEEAEDLQETTGVPKKIVFITFVFALFLLFAFSVPPRIAPFYFEDSITAGMRTQVMCSVSQGDRPFTINWTKDDRSIDASGISISDFPPFSSILSIDNVTSGHTGNYTCQARNKAGQTQYTANLSVTIPPYWVTEPKSEESVILGNSILLHCQADGFPKPSVTWKQALGSQVKNGQPSPDDYRELSYNMQNIILENGTLTIARSSEDHEGFYMCAVHNGIGAGKSKFIHLKVHAGPKFQQRSRQEVGRKGEEVHLRCEATGDLPMQIVWKQRGNIISPGHNERFRLTNNTLTKGILSELSIQDVQHGDRGEYICEASNAYGQDHMSILLLVQEPPSSPKNLHTATQTSRTITVSWPPPLTSGDAKIMSYKLQYKEARDVWHEHNAQKTVSGEETVVVVTNLKPATSYHFRLYAENQLGTSEPSDVLQAATEGEPPNGPPQQVSVEAVAPTILRLIWNPPEKSLWNGEILGYNIGIKRMKSENEEFNWTHVGESSGLPGDHQLTGLSKFTKYLIILRAVNEKGEGPPSEPVVGETMEDVPSGHPQDVQCSSLSPESLQVTWKPPQPSKIHGIIQGYKVFYEPADELTGVMGRQSKMVSSLTTVLHTLQPYTNYSVQVLAFTRAGDGVRSGFMYCITDESTPEAPSAIKAVVSSENAVVISWLPPKNCNGVLTKYTVYIRVLEKGSEIKTIKNTLPAQHLSYEAVGLKKRESYEAWVVASTKVGHGQSTPLVHLTPSTVVPASIISFGRVIVVPWKTEVRLPCLHVGQPRPVIEWRWGDVKIQQHSRLIKVEDKSLLIESVARSNEGNYSCHVRNSLGSDHIAFSLVVQVPPTSPLLLATAVTSSSVQLQWKQGDNGGSVIRGFILSFRKEGSDWKEQTLEPYMNTYLKDDLACGSNYQFKLTGYNKIGRGTASKVTSIMTRGSRPIAPSKTHFLAVHSNYVIFHLRTWSSSGCELTHFSISYRRPPENWFLVFDHLKPQNEFILKELSPGEEYVVKITAHNSAGSTSQEYVFITPTDHAGPGAPDSSAAGEEADANAFHVDTQVVVLGVISIFSVIFLVLGICFCIRKRPSRETICLQDLQTTTFDNTQHTKEREKFYATVMKIPQSPCGDLDRIPEYAEDIYPYATFHLPDQGNLAGNPERSNYLYENQIKHPDSDHYGMFRSRQRRKAKSLKSESEEYDSLESDADTENVTSCRDESPKYQMAQSVLRRHRKDAEAVRERSHHRVSHQNITNRSRGIRTQSHTMRISEMANRPKGTRDRYGSEKKPCTENTASCKNGQTIHKGEIRPESEGKRTQRYVKRYEEGPTKEGMGSKTGRNKDGQRTVWAVKKDGRRTDKGRYGQ
ncbi:hypothetical protein RUM44_006285 [Polyplax serrata]|uniref:Down syndrome cell adhesion molecule-like protein Dscam2 n=1 Tax=Polyplax serrata TaxID=468196 RepID=A0ABR1AID4_POLSC